MQSPSKWQIVFGFWVVWVPSEAIRRTRAYLADRQMLGWYVFMSFALGTLATAYFLGVEKAKDHVFEAIAVGILPALIIIIGRLIWEFLCVPAEIFDSCIRRDALETLCRRGIAYHREGNDILLRMRESNWQNSSELISMRDAWVSNVRALLSGGQENVWVFRFDDVTHMGLSMLGDVGEPMKSAFRRSDVNPEKHAIEREVTSRLAALGEIISELGRLASSSAAVG